MTWMHAIALVVVLMALTPVLFAADAPKPAELRLSLRTQALQPDDQGHNVWRTTTTSATLRPAETAILVCDMWDQHWSRGASERVALMAPRMNDVLKRARARGVTIIHSPSDVIDFYKDAPARQRALAAPRVEVPKPKDRPNPPLPIDDSDGGSDTGEKPWHKAWTRQHPALEIDQERDFISADGQEVWNVLQQRGTKHLLIMGVHTNMCILKRPFAIKALVACGFDVVLVRDLTDAMYNPARSPYVSHAEGTRLVIEYIEKFWCPTVDSSELGKAD